MEYAERKRDPAADAKSLLFSVRRLICQRRKLILEIRFIRPAHRKVKEESGDNGKDKAA
jgi:hypothetical protein